MHQDDRLPLRIKSGPSSIQRMVIQVVKRVVPHAGLHHGYWIARSLLLCFLITPLAHAETMYITDILRLGIHKSPDTSDKAFKILASGDSLEILEKNTFYARVRTTEGDEGWVKYSYLVSDKPSQAVLMELNKERDALTTELAALRRQQAEYVDNLSALRIERDDLQRSVDSNSTQINSLSSERETLTSQLDAKRFSIPIQWLLLTGLVALFSGFIGGWWWIDAKQRARHGGYRI